MATSRRQRSAASEAVAGGCTTGAEHIVSSRDTLFLRRHYFKLATSTARYLTEVKLLIAAEANNANRT